MTCDDCPELGSMAPKSAVFHIAYTGGTEANFYALAGWAIPQQNKAVMLQYGWPRVEPDGTVIYEGGQEPPAPEGYIRTGPGRFRPAWPSCVYRMLKVRFLDLTGNLDIRAVCSNPQPGKPAGKPLTLAGCQGCTARELIRGPVVWPVAWPIAEPTGRVTGRTEREPSPPCPPGSSSA